MRWREPCTFEPAAAAAATAAGLAGCAVVHRPRRRHMFGTTPMLTGSVALFSRRELNALTVSTYTTDEFNAYCVQSLYGAL